MNRKGFRDPRFDDLAAYALDALAPEEREQADILLARSEEARLELAALQETASALASLASPAEPPEALRARILAAAVSGVSKPMELPAIKRHTLATSNGHAEGVGSKVHRTNWPVRTALAASLASLAAAVVLAVVFVLQTSSLRRDLRTVNSRLAQEQAEVASVKEEVSEVKSDLVATSEQSGFQQEQVSRLAQANSALQSAIRDQRWLTYVTFNRNWETPSWFRPSPDAPMAQGQIVMSPIGDRAVLFVDSLPALPDGMTYQLWLQGDGWNWPAAPFTVDEYGYARVDIVLPPGVARFTSAAVTRETIGAVQTASLEVLKAPATR